ncbi:MAG: hypothetical protein HUU21_19415, partial [Polyangiaceae bacterium]|nr:hypothetical protein [Polyangiaceae bacterium]
ALGEAGAALLGKELSRDLGATVSVRAVAVSPEPIAAAPEEGIAWFAKATRALEAVSAVEALSACVEVPVVPADSLLLKEVSGLVAALRASPAFQSGRLHITDGERWSAVVSTAPCEDKNAAVVDAGAPPDASAPEAGAVQSKDAGQ